MLTFFLGNSFSFPRGKPTAARSCYPAYSSIPNVGGISTEASRIAFFRCRRVFNMHKPAAHTVLVFFGRLTRRNRHCVYVRAGARARVRPFVRACSYPVCAYESLSLTYTLVHVCKTKRIYKCFGFSPVITAIKGLVRSVPFIITIIIPSPSD